MSSLNDGWRIPALHEICQGCEAPLNAGERVTTVLSFGDLGPERSDLCEACGNSVGNSAGEASSAALRDSVFWRRVRPEDRSRRPLVDYALLREVFARLLGRSEPLYARLSYLVGLVLVRKRHLRLKGFEIRRGREVMLVTRGAGQPEIEVPAPFLSPEDMVVTRDYLMNLLAIDLGEEGLPDLATLVAHPEGGPAASGALAPEAPEVDAAAEVSGGAAAPGPGEAAAGAAAGASASAGDGPGDGPGDAAGAEGVVAPKA